LTFWRFGKKYGNSPLISALLERGAHFKQEVRPLSSGLSPNPQSAREGEPH
jgi:hypothetical protein